MAKLGSEKRPAIIRVKTEARAVELISICNKNGWQVIEDISDVEPLLNPPSTVKTRQ